MASSWSEFATEAATLAAGAESLFGRYEVMVLGTISQTHRPRLFLVEPRVIGGCLVIGTSNDEKADDLRRDARCSLHTLVDHRTHDEPVFKADVVARDVGDDELTTLARALARPEIRWLPQCVFELRLDGAALVAHGLATRWRSGSGD